MGVANVLLCWWGGGSGDGEGEQLRRNAHTAGVAAGRESGRDSSGLCRCIV